MGYIFCYAEPKTQDMLTQHPNIHRRPNQLPGNHHVDLFVVQYHFTNEGARQIRIHNLMKLVIPRHYTYPIIITYWCVELNPESSQHYNHCL